MFTNVKRLFESKEDKEAMNEYYARLAWYDKQLYDLKKSYGKIQSDVKATEGSYVLR